MTNQIIEKVLVTDFASEGKVLAKVEGKAVFIEHAIPGDVVDIEIYKSKKRLSFARPVRFHQYSEKRAAPFCEHFGICGGCKWQHLAYQEQLKFKQREVMDALTRIGKVQVKEVLPIIGAEDTKFYRNKLEFTFSNNRWLTPEEMRGGGIIADKNALGFHLPQNFSKILDINTCYLQDDWSNIIRRAVRKYAIDNRLDFFDIRQQKGFLRNLIIRNSTIGEWMVIVSFGHESEEIKKLMDFLVHQFPQITSLHDVVNPKRNDTIFDLDIHTYHGRGFIYEELAGAIHESPLRFKVSPKSFFQTNTRQAQKLYETVERFAELKGDETVYDLYTGTGSIAIYLAKKCKKVTGIEQIASAIEDANFNAELNEVNNIEFLTGDIRHTLNSDFMMKHGKPDLIITDPPRSGMHPDVVKALLEISPERIVYVSCNPSTQARDLEMLSGKYRVEKIQPVDMFPHTHHIENVAVCTSDW